MNGLELLKEDHRKVQELFEQVKTIGNERSGSINGRPFYSVLTGPTSRTRISTDKLASADNQADQTAGKPAIESTPADGKSSPILDFRRRSK